MPRDEPEEPDREPQTGYDRGDLQDQAEAGTRRDPAGSGVGRQEQKERNASATQPAKQELDARAHNVLCHQNSDTGLGYIRSFRLRRQVILGQAVLQDLEGGVHIISELEQVQIARIDHAVAHERIEV